MRGIDKALIGQPEKFGVQRIKKQATELRGRPAERRAQIGTAYIADKKSVAGQDGVRLAFADIAIEHHDGDGFRGVARGFHDFQTDTSEFQFVAITHGVKGVAGLCRAAQVDGGAGAITELKMSRKKIGMEVGEKDVLDLQAVFGGEGQVVVGVALRVDDNGGAGFLIADQVGSVRKTRQIKLLQDHVLSFAARRCRGMILDFSSLLRVIRCMTEYAARTQLAATGKIRVMLGRDGILRQGEPTAHFTWPRAKWRSP